MSYNYHEQTLTSYRNVRYGSNTIYNAGCGPASLCNALDALGLGSYTVKRMCTYSTSVGARVDGGTDMHVLLRHAANRYGFTYRTSNKNAELADHLRSGGVAIMNQGNRYGVFANGGHYVCAVAIDNNDRVTIIDSYWNSTKYRTWPKYHAKSKVLSRCIVTTPLYWCGRATVDRSPSYYLISKPTKNAQESVERNTDTMTETEVRKLIDTVAEEKAKQTVSQWAADAWIAAKNAGIMDGTSPRKPLTREEYATTIGRLGLIPTDSEPSAWASDIWKAAVAAGVVDGTDPHGLVTREMAVQMLVNAGLIEGTKIQND